MRYWLIIVALVVLGCVAHSQVVVPATWVRHSWTEARRAELDALTHENAKYVELYSPVFTPGFQPMASGIFNGIDNPQVAATTETFDGPTWVDTSRPEFWKMVEAHCVAVLSEKRVEKIPTMSIGFEAPHEIDDQGNEIVHVPEVTLKLRCQ